MHYSELLKRRPNLNRFLRYAAQTLGAGIVGRTSAANIYIRAARPVVQTSGRSMVRAQCRRASTRRLPGIDGQLTPDRGRQTVLHFAAGRFRSDPLSVAR